MGDVFRGFGRLIPGEELLDYRPVALCAASALAVGRVAAAAIRWAATGTCGTVAFAAASVLGDCFVGNVLFMSP